MERMTFPAVAYMMVAWEEGSDRSAKRYFSRRTASTHQTNEPRSAYLSLLPPL